MKLRVSEYFFGAKLVRTFAQSFDCPSGQQKLKFMHSISVLFFSALLIGSLRLKTRNVFH